LLASFLVVYSGQTRPMACSGCRHALTGFVRIFSAANWHQNGGLFSHTIF
jgi:hypothetical protein